MNRHLAQLQPYPFEKLARLKEGAQPPANLSSIMLSVGEPKHNTPDFIKEALASSLGGLSSYPLTVGSEELRTAIGNWLGKRFSLKSIDPLKHVLPVNGTREALFAFAQCIVEPGSDALVAMPNPFYQIYEGAVLLAGAKPYFVNASTDNGYLPDFEAVPADIWERCQMVYICTPYNPTGAIMSATQLRRLIELSHEHNFVIASDECYSEIYFQAPPVGLLAVAESMDIDGYRNCMVFHSLSKRSNVPGMRSGFVAGDAKLIDSFRLYRTYHGCAMSPPIQAASALAWADEKHVEENRGLYRRKFKAVLDILSSVLPVEQPQGAFYLWPQTPMDDTTFARDLFAQTNITVLPGSYLSRPAHGTNPGEQRVRMALVAPEAECIEAAHRLAAFLNRVKETV
jgi:N-succinyldiaminopimelate aminotransferase